MPTCVSCGHEGATAEFRRRPRHPGEFVCWDRGGCGYRVKQAKLEERARKLTPRRRRRIELAAAQLAALRDDLGPAFDTPPMLRVRTALEQLEAQLAGEEIAA